MSTSIADDRAGARTTEKHSSRRLASVHPAVCTGATPGSKSSGRGAVPHPVRAGPGLAGAGTAPPRPVHPQRLNSRELGRQCSAGTPVLGQELRKRRSTETSLLERTSWGSLAVGPERPSRDCRSSSQARASTATITSRRAPASLANRESASSWLRSAPAAARGGGAAPLGSSQRSGAQIVPGESLESDDYVTPGACFAGQPTRGSCIARTANRRGTYKQVSFTFCGYMYRRRKAYNQRLYVVFTGFMPAVSPDKLTAMSRRGSSWRIHRRTTLTLDDLAAEINLVLRGWLAYFTVFCRARWATGIASTAIWCDRCGGSTNGLSAAVPVHGHGFGESVQGTPSCSCMAVLVSATIAGRHEPYESRDSRADLCGGRRVRSQPATRRDEKALHRR